jgi:hypothetical protein
VILAKGQAMIGLVKWPASFALNIPVRCTMSSTAATRQLPPRCVRNRGRGPGV